MLSQKFRGLFLGGFAAACGVVSGGAAQALPVLSEFYYDAVGSDDGESFVEIYGAPGTSLEGLALDGINGTNGAVSPTIVLSGSIGASGLFVAAGTSLKSNWKRKGIFEGTGLPSLVAGTNTRRSAASMAEASKSSPPEVVTFA